MKAYLLPKYGWHGDERVKWLNTERDQSWVGWSSWYICSCVCNCLELGKWFQTCLYIYKRWTSFGTSSGSHHPWNDWQNPRYNFEWSTNKSTRNSWGSRHIASYKHNRVVVFEAILALFRRNADKLLRQYITVDETRIHHYTPETKEHSNQWVFAGERAPKKAKTVKSSGNGCLGSTRNHLDQLFGKRTNDNWSISYASLLHRLSNAIKKKLSH